MAHRIQDEAGHGDGGLRHGDCEAGSTLPQPQQAHCETF